MMRLRRWGRIKGLVISWPKSNWAKEIRKRGSRRTLQVALSEMAGMRSLGGVDGRKTQRRPREKREAVVGVGREDIGGIGIGRGTKNGINTGQGAEIGVDMDVDPTRKRAGEIEVEAGIEGRGGIGAEALTGEDMKGKTASRGGMMGDGQEGADHQTADEKNCGLQFHSNLARSLGTWHRVTALGERTDMMLFVHGP